MQPEHGTMHSGNGISYVIYSYTEAVMDSRKS